MGKIVVGAGVEVRWPVHADPERDYIAVRVDGKEIGARSIVSDAATEGSMVAREIKAVWDAAKRHSNHGAQGGGIAGYVVELEAATWLGPGLETRLVFGHAKVYTTGRGGRRALARIRQRRGLTFATAQVYPVGIRRLGAGE